MSHQYEQSEMRRFYRSLTDLFTGFESLEEVPAGYDLTFPARGPSQQDLEQFGRDFTERFPGYDVSVEVLANGRHQMQLRSRKEGLEYLGKILAAAPSGELALPSRWVEAYRRASNPLRLEPSFLVIGAPRSGTTSLYTYLSEHPRFLGPTTKELGFFDVFYARGLAHYRSQFPLAFKRTGDGSRGKAVTGEATPTYLANPLIPERVRAAYPAIKLIAMVRNPVDRAFSQYQLGVRRGFERLSFEEAIDQEPARLAGEVDRLRADPKHFSRGWTYHSYLTTGHYAEHLERWTQHYPREQLLVVGLEDFHANPGREFRRVLDFLELPPFEPAQFEKVNAFTYSDLKPETRARLLEHFRPHNERLWEFLGRDLGWNQTATPTRSEASR